MKRNFGLDLIRACAILMVLVDHAWYFGSNPLYMPNQFSVLGFFGVEIFFVLSGFLIGQIVVRDLIHDMNFSGIFRFYVRRWMRTLPLYYLVLVSLIVLSNLIYRTTEIHPYHFFFLQNFIPREAEFFGVAWSLAIEEWFYLSLPLFLLLFYKKVQLQKKLIGILLLGIVAIFLARLIFVFAGSTTFEQMRKEIFFRFDSLLIGVFLAVLKTQYGKIYNRLQQAGVFCISLAVLISVGWYYAQLNASSDLDLSFFFKTIGFLVISISVAGIIPAIENSWLLNKGISQKGMLFSFFTTTSLISYSLYLIHLQLFSFMIKIFSNTIPAVPLFFISTVLAYIVCYLTYHFFEKPILLLRNKVT